MSIIVFQACNITKSFSYIISEIKERTNLIKITWPASGGSASSSETVGIPTGVTWLHTNVSGWTQTGTLASVSVSGGTITLNYDKANTWTSVGI